MEKQQKRLIDYLDEKLKMFQEHRDQKLNNNEKNFNSLEKHITTNNTR